MTPLSELRVRATLVERLRKGSVSYNSLSGPVYSGPTELEREAADALEAAEREKAELREALTQIVALKPEPFVFPPDWQEQIDACPECQRYKGHPIQAGICDKHRQPIYARDRHDSFEVKAIGPRARSIARSTLSRVDAETPND